MSALYIGWRWSFCMYARQSEMLPYQKSSDPYRSLSIISMSSYLLSLAFKDFSDRRYQHWIKYLWNLGFGSATVRTKIGQFLGESYFRLVFLANIPRLIFQYPIFSITISWQKCFLLMNTISTACNGSPCVCHGQRRSSIRLTPLLSHSPVPIQRPTSNHICSLALAGLLEYFFLWPLFRSIFVERWKLTIGLSPVDTR